MIKLLHRLLKVIPIKDYDALHVKCSLERENLINKINKQDYVIDKLKSELQLISKQLNEEKSKNKELQNKVSNLNNEILLLKDKDTWYRKYINSLSSAAVLMNKENQQ